MELSERKSYLVLIKNINTGECEDMMNLSCTPFELGAYSRSIGEELATHFPDKYRDLIMLMFEWKDAAL